MASRVRCVVRVRPALTSANATDECCITIGADGKTASIANPMNETEVIAYTLDGCRGSETTQRALFDTEVAPLIDRVVSHGERISILAYGMTGAGKTFTMQGGPDDESRGSAAFCMKS